MFGGLGKRLILSSSWSRIREACLTAARCSVCVACSSTIAVFAAGSGFKRRLQVGAFAVRVHPRHGRLVRRVGSGRRRSPIARTSGGEVSTVVRRIVLGRVNRSGQTERPTAECVVEVIKEEAGQVILVGLGSQRFGEKERADEYAPFLTDSDPSGQALRAVPFSPLRKTVCGGGNGNTMGSSGGFE